MAKVQIREEDLYPPVRDWFAARGCQVKGEVGHLDLMAIHGELILAAELKLTLNIDVILQAVKRQRIAHGVWIAVPKKSKAMASKRWTDLLHLLRRLELGLLVVSLRGGGGVVEEVLAPQPFRRDLSQGSARRVRNQLLTEFHSRTGDLNLGGVSGRKLVTAYREQAIQIAVLLREHGPLSIARLRELGAGCKVAAILQDNHYRWFNRVSRGVYQLSGVGSQEMAKYPQLVNLYSQTPE